MTTQILALIFGVYMVIAALKILFTPAFYMEMINGLKANTALSFLCGVMIYFIGAILLALHYSFATPLAGAVTIFSGLMAIEGLAIMFVPKLILNLPAGIGFQHHSRSWGLFALAIGAGLSVWALI